AGGTVPGPGAAGAAGPAERPRPAVPGLSADAARTAAGLARADDPRQGEAPVGDVDGAAARVARLAPHPAAPPAPPRPAPPADPAVPAECLVGADGRRLERERPADRVDRPPGGVGPDGPRGPGAAGLALAAPLAGLADAARVPHDANFAGRPPGPDDPLRRERLVVLEGGVDE